MNCILSIIGAAFVVIIFALCLKIRLLQISAREITQAFQDRLMTDTNTLIDLSSRDPYMRQLASDINVQLRMLRGERQRYQRGDAEVKEAVTNISHDLRTPLTAICGYLELLKQQNLSPDAERYLAQIENRTQAMKCLTEELFRYSLTVSEQELHLTPLNLRRALEEALLSFYGAFHQKGIIPKLHLSEQKINFLLDGAALNRILGNILTNVLKYSTSDLEVSLNETGRIRFSNLAPDLNSITVGKLFDRYYTVNTAHNSSGLGLSIAKRLTEQMDGRIWAEYESGCLTIMLDFSELAVSE